MDILVSEGVEHYLPTEEEGHRASEHCDCRPLRAIRSGQPGWFHRTLATA